MAANFRPDVANAEGEQVTRLLASGAARLASSPSAALDAQLLLGYVLGRDRSWVLAHDDYHASSAESAAFRRLIERRSCGEPVAYIRGVVQWYGMELEVTPEVLIPCPETELMVEEAIRMAADHRASRIADIGTGSGAIAIALARASPHCRVVATDSSDSALEVAARNVKRMAVDERISLQCGDLLTPVLTRPDLLVANLPYLSATEMADLPRDVRHEPVGALYGGQFGWELYERLLDQLSERAWHIPFILELDPRQADHLCSGVRARLPVGRLAVLQDYAGDHRFVVYEP